ncbi:MarR family transcriptional regulator [Amycolatopsis sp. NPDC048633]|uniref:MarR family winged helix-turn-helix transcriptional regulator n=1 Tax=Amycolatopsis sp. NPDC048633 TaxID=3157095 RepID=UPI0033DAA594
MFEVVQGFRDQVGRFEGGGTSRSVRTIPMKSERIMTRLAIDGAGDVDEEGLLHDPRTRVLLRGLAEEGDTAAMEAAVALSAAMQLVGRTPWTGAAGTGLPTGSVEVLLRLNVAPAGLSMGMLARSIELPPYRVSRLVDFLSQEGLASRQRDLQDRRSLRVTITRAGAELLVSLRKPARQAMRSVFAGFTQAELAQLRHLCLRVARNGGAGSRRGSFPRDGVRSQPTTRT